LNRISKKTVESFDQLGTRINDQEIVYLQNQKSMNKKVREEKWKDFKKHKDFSEKFTDS
jgi:hypothetical protein